MATKLRRILYVGLGGTGMKTLLHTKKVLYDTYGEIPPMVGFLGIDTDGGEYNKFLTARDGTRISLATAEQMRISVPYPRSIFENSPSNFDWIPAGNAGGLDSLDVGAGQIRSNGRFAITINEEDVRNRVSNKIQQITSANIINNSQYELLSTDIEVHMVFSLGGGTGCGTFLNMAYLLRDILPEVKLSGYAVMADVFRAMRQGASMARVRTNAYGAIKDLDYMMSLDAMSEPVEIKWLRRSESVNRRPFTAFYLIDNKNSNRDAFNNVDQLCEMISLSLITSIGELSVATNSIADNVNKVISEGTMGVRDKKAWVAGIGVSEVRFDGRALADIYANKARIQLISSLKNGGCDDPSVIANNWIDNERIRENLGRDDVIDYFMAQFPQYPFADINDLSNPLPECTEYLNGNAVDKDSELNQKLDDLKQRIAVSLDKLVDRTLNRECGVYLAENVLHAVGKQIELCDGEMADEIAGCENIQVQSDSALKSSCRELEECNGILKRGKRKELANEVIDEVNNQAKARREIKRRRYARMFYSWLRERVSEKFTLIDGITRNLNAVAQRSADNIETIRQGINSGFFFQEDLTALKVDDIKCSAQDVLTGDFIKYLEDKGGVTALATISSEQVAERMWNYVIGLPVTGKWESMTVEDVLRSLSAGERAEVLQRAIRKALPLLPFTPHGYNADIKCQPEDGYYVGVGDKKTSCLNEDNYFRNLVPNQTNTEIVSTGVSDRIIIYRQVAVLPPFFLTSVDGYRPEYEQWEKDKEFGSHWDLDLAKRMKKERFKLEPQSNGGGNELEYWVNGLIFGLINYNTDKGVYQIESRALGGRPVLKYKVDMGQTRNEAFNFLADNLDLVEQEMDSKIQAMNVPGPENPLDIFPGKARKAVEDGTYVSVLSQWPHPEDQIEHFEAEAELLDKEIEYITDNF